jgi:hypothetical protein
MWLYQVRKETSHVYVYKRYRFCLIPRFWIGFLNCSDSMVFFKFLYEQTDEYISFYITDSPGLTSKCLINDSLSFQVNGMISLQSAKLYLTTVIFVTQSFWFSFIVVRSLFLEHLFIQVVLLIYWCEWKGVFIWKFKIIQL